MRKLFCLVMLFALLAQAERVVACSMCRAGDHGFFINSARTLPAGRLLFGLDHWNTSKSALVVQHHAEEGLALAKSFAGARIFHDEEELATQVQNTVQASLQYGASSRVMLFATLPYTFNRMTMAHEVSKGDGFGDPEVTAMFTLSPATSKLMLNVHAGARLPFGQSELKDASGAMLDHHVQPGTGAWAGIFGAQMFYPAGNVPLFASASYQANASNDHDFAYGDVLRYNFAAQFALARFVDVIGEVNGRFARFDKEGVEKDPHSGGSVVYASPGLRWKIFSGVALRTQVQIPIVERLNGVQDEDVNFRTGLIFSR